MTEPRATLPPQISSRLQQLLARIQSLPRHEELLYDIVEYLEDSIIAAPQLPGDQIGTPRRKVMRVTFWTGWDKTRIDDNISIKTFREMEEPTESEATPPGTFPPCPHDPARPDPRWALFQIREGSTQYCYYVGGRRVCYRR